LKKIKECDTNIFKEIILMKRTILIMVVFLGLINLNFAQEQMQKIYKSVEINLMSDIAPYNAVFNIGIEKLYGSLIFSYYPTFFQKYDTKYIGLGMGIGSILHLTEDIFFNPELMCTSTVEMNNMLFFSIKNIFGYKISKHFDLFLGPSVTWVHHPANSYDLHFIGIPYLGRININENNTVILLGTKAGIRLKI
jgi:hypothetical protein